MDEAMKLLPSTIEAATKGTPICDLMRVTGERPIQAFVAFELAMLATMVNVDERLNIQEHQLPILAQELVRMFPTESLADFHVCFRRGSMGLYDEKLLRIDGAVITQWMKKYLEEKYQVIENKLMAERDNPYTVRVRKAEHENVINPERNLLALFKAVVGDLKPEAENNADENAYQRWKLEQFDQSPYKYFNVRGLSIMARSQEQAEEIVKEMIKNGDIEEYKPE